MYTDDISLALSNQEHPPKPNLYIGNGSTALSLTFTVNADEGVVLTPDGAIQIFMPRQVFAEEEVKRMSVSAPGWSYTGVDGARGRYFLMKPVTGQTLARGTSFAFTLSNVACAKPKQVAGNVTAKFVGIDVFPSDSNAPLSLCAVPQGNPRDLMEAIAFTLSGIEESSSSVYRSDELSSPVKNTLVLNIKNKRADRAVIDNVTAWNKDEVPTLSIFFVYGDSPGALTQGWVDSIDSAGKIKANLHELYANKWHPTWPGQGGELSWQLTPLKDSNHEALGFGPDANVDIEFTDIVTTAPIGHTQMYIHYHSFPGYLDGIATLDIHKKQPKRGVLGFKASPSLVYVGDSVNLIWSTCDIAKVILSYEDENGGATVQQPAERSRRHSHPADPAKWTGRHQPFPGEAQAVSALQALRIRFRRYIDQNRRRAGIRGNRSRCHPGHHDPLPAANPDPDATVRFPGADQIQMAGDQRQRRGYFHRS
jgi:hypothetical protein